MREGPRRIPIRRLRLQPLRPRLAEGGWPPRRLNDLFHQRQDGRGDGRGSGDHGATREEMMPDDLQLDDAESLLSEAIDALCDPSSSPSSAIPSITLGP